MQKRIAPPSARVAPTRRRGVVRVEHPILRLHVLAPDGTTTTDHRVFCRMQQVAVSAGACTQCLRCEAIVGSPEPTVQCALPASAAAGSVSESATGPATFPSSADHDGSATSVGSMLHGSLLALEPGTTVGDARRTLREEHRRSIAVVNAAHHVIGVVHESTLASARGRAADPRLPVDHVMASTLVIEDITPIRRALELLAAAHLREATVVDAEGVPLGTFRDVEGLDWITAHRARG